MWCPLPEYIPLSCVLGFLAVAVFLRLPVLVKTLLLVSMATVYSLLIFITHIKLFTCYDIRVGYVTHHSFGDVDNDIDIVMHRKSDT